MEQTLYIQKQTYKCTHTHTYIRWNNPFLGTTASSSCRATISAYVWRRQQNYMKLNLIVKALCKCNVTLAYLIRQQHIYIYSFHFISDILFGQKGFCVHTCIYKKRLMEILKKKKKKSGSKSKE